MVDVINKGDRVDVVPRDAQGAAVVVTTQNASIARQELAPFSRIMYVTMLPSVWETGANPPPSKAEFTGGEIRLTLGSIDDLASVWARGIATLLSSGR